MASQKVRFDVFKRDNFTCQYCGRKSPEVILEADHIIPASDGGKADFDNLITSCRECNRGKSNSEIIPKDDTDLPEYERALKEHQDMINNIENMKESLKELYKKLKDFRVKSFESNVLATRQEINRLKEEDANTNFDTIMFFSKYLGYLEHMYEELQKDYEEILRITYDDPECGSHIKQI